jgi:branched-chain amino acid transport system permease protein
MIIGVILTATLIWWVRKTRAGLALRAVAQDKETSSLYGISSNRFGLLAFGVGCGLAGAAGGLMAPILYVNPFMGAGPLLKIFVVIVIGGLGSISGALIAGIMIGMVDSFMTTIFDSETAALIGFVLIIIMLVFRPTGIMGHD